jgi:hypothetical protein
VRYDGYGNIYIGGANENRSIHTDLRDCKGYSQGWKKIIKFNKDFTRNFYISVGTSFDSHNDCGGSAYWKTSKLNQQFYQRCSWSEQSQVPLITVDLILERNQVSTQKEVNINLLLGQWYLVGSTIEEKRPCVISTIYRHSKRLFYKKSTNIGNRVFRVTDHPIESMDIKKQLFKMNKNIYTYKMTRYTISNKDYDILFIINTNDKNEQYVFAAELYNTNILKDIINENYRGNKAISLSCYFD